jgi:hypothetical protein
MLLHERRFQPVAIPLGSIGIVACSDTGQPTFPQTHVGSADPTQIAQLPPTIDDEFARIAREEIPGFAGHYVDRLPS